MVVVSFFLYLYIFLRSGFLGKRTSETDHIRIGFAATVISLTCRHPLHPTTHSPNKN